jgi:hypothetical protein
MREEGEIYASGRKLHEVVQDSERQHCMERRWKQRMEAQKNEKQ